MDGYQTHIMREFRDLDEQQKIIAARYFRDVLRTLPFDALVEVPTATIAMAFEMLDSLPAEDA